MTAVLDLDDIMEKAAAAPWDFKVKLGGVDYSTRRPTPEEMQTLQNGLSKLPPDQAFALLRSFFVEPSPPMEQLSQHQLTAFLAAYLAYRRRLMQSSIEQLVSEA